MFFPHLGYTPVLARVVQAELCSAVLRAQRNVNGLCNVSHSLSTQDATFAQDVLRPQCVPPAWVGEDREASGVSATQATADCTPRPLDQRLTKLYLSR